jgi:hypothetical protein
VIIKPNLNWTDMSLKVLTTKEITQSLTISSDENLKEKWIKSREQGIKREEELVHSWMMMNTLKEMM